MATTRRSRAPRSKKSPSPDAVQNDVSNDVGVLSTRALEVLYPGLGDAAQTAAILEALDAGWDDLLA
jgi:hypothetical protein